MDKQKDCESDLQMIQNWAGYPVPRKTEIRFKMNLTIQRNGLKEKNRMKFNRDKCKVLRVRKRNQSTCVKELGIIVDYKLNMSQHCDIVAERANAI